MIEIKELLEKNKLYIMFLGIGLILLVFSTSFSGTQSNDSKLEIRLKTVLEKIDGVGEISVMISSNANNEVEGVVVVARGAENPTVRMIINDAAIAVLGVKPHKIQVYAQKKEEAIKK